VRDKIILLGHGSGGQMMSDLINDVILPNIYTDGFFPEQEDAAFVDAPPGRLLFTTDSYVVDPFIFPGGNIGDLAVNGTINDLAMRGGTPIAISLGFILEEGLFIEDLKTVLRSIGCAARDAGAHIVCGDTKVVPRGRGDKIYINTSGVGAARDGLDIKGANARAGDVLIINGTIGDHGVAVLSKREGMRFETPAVSDTAALHTLVDDLLNSGVETHTLRDPTRGGLATVVVEIAEAAGVCVKLDERSIPVSRAVAGACEILGLDPLLVANEGKVIAVVAGKDADKALSVMRAHPLGREAAIIGEVTQSPAGRVTMTSFIGGSRIINRLPGELLPMIC